MLSSHKADFQPGAHANAGAPGSSLKRTRNWGKKIKRPQRPDAE